MASDIASVKRGQPLSARGGAGAVIGSAGSTGAGLQFPSVGEAGASAASPPAQPRRYSAGGSQVYPGADESPPRHRNPVHSAGRAGLASCGAEDCTTSASTAAMSSSRVREGGGSAEHSRMRAPLEDECLEADWPSSATSTYASASSRSSSSGAASTSSSAATTSSGAASIDRSSRAGDRDEGGGAGRTGAAPSGRSSAVGPTASVQVVASARKDLHQDFIMRGKEFGRGRYGVVRTCVERQSGKVMACKSISKDRLTDEQQIEELQMEIELMRRLAGHPYIVEAQAVYEDEASVYVVMELCMGGDLFDLLSHQDHLAEPEACRLFRKIVQAVKYCHAHRVVHRDIKPENILLSDVSTLEPKLADFGMALELPPGSAAQGLAGSCFYMAPEVVKRQLYSFPADIWSLGVLLYIMLSGILPFWGETEQLTYESVCLGRMDFSLRQWQLVSLAAKDLIHWMCCLDASQRPTAEQILAHPWLARGSGDGGTGADEEDDDEDEDDGVSPEAFRRSASQMVGRRRPDNVVTHRTALQQMQRRTWARLPGAASAESSAINAMVGGIGERSRSSVTERTPLGFVDMTQSGVTERVHAAMGERPQRGTRGGAQAGSPETALGGMYQDKQGPGRPGPPSLAHTHKQRARLADHAAEADLGGPGPRLAHAKEYSTHPLRQGRGGGGEAARREALAMRMLQRASSGIDSPVLASPGLGEGAARASTYLSRESRQGSLREGRALPQPQLPVLPQRQRHAGPLLQRQQAQQQAPQYMGRQSLDSEQARLVPTPSARQQAQQLRAQVTDPGALELASEREQKVDIAGLCAARSALGAALEGLPAAGLGSRLAPSSRSQFVLHSTASAESPPRAPSGSALPPGLRTVSPSLRPSSFSSPLRPSPEGRVPGAGSPAIGRQSTGPAVLQVATRSALERFDSPPAALSRPPRVPESPDLRTGRPSQGLSAAGRTHMGLEGAQNREGRCRIDTRMKEPPSSAAHGSLPLPVPHDLDVPLDGIGSGKLSSLALSRQGSQPIRGTESEDLGELGEGHMDAVPPAPARSKSSGLAPAASAAVAAAAAAAALHGRSRSCDVLAQNSVQESDGAMALPGETSGAGLAAAVASPPVAPRHTPRPPSMPKKSSGSAPRPRPRRLLTESSRQEGSSPCVPSPPAISELTLEEVDDSKR